MISTQSGVWLRPAILGGFDGTSDRSFLFICAFLALREVAGEEFYVSDVASDMNAAKATVVVMNIFRGTISSQRLFRLRNNATAGARMHAPDCTYE